MYVFKTIDLLGKRIKKKISLIYSMYCEIPFREQKLICPSLVEDGDEERGEVEFFSIHNYLRSHSCRI